MSERETPQQKRYCPNCGAEIRSGTRFCVSCGERLDKGNGGSVETHPPRSMRPIKSDPNGSEKAESDSKLQSLGESSRIESTALLAAYTLSQTMQTAQKVESYGFWHPTD